MSQFNQSGNPENLVANIIGKKIYLDDVSSRMVDTVKGLGAFERSIGTAVFWMIECAEENELIKTLQELNRLGFLFVGAAAGYPAADVFALLLEKKKLSDKFKEITWRGPGEWTIIEK